MGSSVSIIKLLFPTVLLAFLLYSALPAAALSKTHLELRGEKMSLKAYQVDLRDLLHLLQEQGVSVHIDPGIKPKVSASFSNQPVDRVLSAILKSYDYSTVWQKTDTSKGDHLHLVELRIFEQGLEYRTVSLKSSVNLAIERNADVRYVKNSLLVKLLPGIDHHVLEDLLTKVGGYNIEPANDFGVIRISLPDSVSPEEAAKLLLQSGIIAVAEPDYAFRLPEATLPINPNEGVEPEDFETGPGQALPMVAVLDSGLAEHFEDGDFVSSFYDAVAGTAGASDRVGHGTQMSLIAAGVVQPLGTRSDEEGNLPIIAVRAFDDNGYTSNYTLMRGIDYALDSGARIISMSWGTETPNSMFESIVEYASSHGAVLLAAAGNSPSGLPVYPAAYEEVIGVGALNPDGSVWDQSNFGESVSVWAPGVVVVDDGGNNDKKAYVGTSVATAYMAKRVAGFLKEHPEMDASSIWRQISVGGISGQSTGAGQ